MTLSGTPDDNHAKATRGKGVYSARNNEWLYRPFSKQSVVLTDQSL